MDETSQDQMAELLKVQRHQALRMDQLRVMLGVILCINAVELLVFLTALTR